MASTVNIVNQPDENQPEKNKTFLDMRMGEKLQFLKEVSVVQPLLVTYLVAIVISQPAMSYLKFEKPCRSNLGQNESLCLEFIHYTINQQYKDIYSNTTALWNDIDSWQEPCQKIVPIILLLFVGAYSDRYKMRKLFMVLPLFGELIATIGYILSAIYMSEWSVEILGYFETIPSFFGGLFMLNMAIFTYVADCSIIELRTLSFAVVQVMFRIALRAGHHFTTKIILAKFSYVVVFSIAASLYTFGILYGIFGIKNKKSVETTNDKEKIRLYNVRNAFDTIKFLFKKHNKNVFFLYALLCFITGGILYVEGAKLFIFLQHYLLWGNSDYVFYEMGNTILQLIGILFYGHLFTLFNDVSILVSTFFVKVVITIIIEIGKFGLPSYATWFVSLTTDIIQIVLRSIATKIVSRGDYGKSLALYGICESLGYFVITPVFIILLVNTLMTSAFIYCETFVFGICFLLSHFFKVSETESEEEKQENSSNINGIENNQTTQV